MSLSSQIEELHSRLAASPWIEDEPSLAGARDQLSAALEQMLEHHTRLLRERRVMMQDLIACIGNARKNTPEWLSANSPEGRTYLVGSREEVEEFAAAALRHGIVPQLIDELTGGERRLTELLGELIKLAESELAGRLKEMDDALVQDFCTANGIRISRAKGSFNRPRTVGNIVKKIAELREFLRLSSLGS